MNDFLRTLIKVLQSLFSGGSAQAAPLDADTTLGSGGGTEPPPNTSHALVLPDKDFRTWYEATRDYTAHFKNVIIVRSPAGNDLNRYRVVSAVRAPSMWVNNDPVAHIRRAYLNVVTVDLVNATTPAELANVLRARVQANKRYGDPANQFTRFTLDWATDSPTLSFTRLFDADLGNGKFHEGLQLAAPRGTPVRAAVAGTVFNVLTDNSTLGYGQYVQVQTRANNIDYLVSYTNLQNIRVRAGQAVAQADLLGECASEGGIKLVVQQPGVQTGTRYAVTGAINPLPLIYVEGISLNTTATSGLNIRDGQGTQFNKVGFMQPTDTAKPLELHGFAIRKLNSTEQQNQWLNVDTSAGVTGWAAAWLLQARSPRSAQPANTRFNGVNLDLLHPLGKPDPARLRDVTYVRMAYNVSMGRGSQDLNAAYNLYAPYFDRLQAAGKQVILVYTHQTFGEGAGYQWNQMNPDRWRELSARLADFVRVIANQYKGRGVIAAHQIWNEQDAYEGAEASVRMPATDYGAMLTYTLQAIRSVDSTTPIITGGHTGGPVAGPNYIRQAFSVMPTNLRPDGIADHPYGRGAGVVPKYEQFGHIEECIVNYWNVLPGKRVWFTEWGVLNAPNEPPSDMSIYALTTLNHMRERHPEKIAAAIWYAWADGMHNGYGLVNRSDQPKEPFFSNYLGIR